ncbi:MAG: hypothetical protein NDI75_06215 [Candidatus Didemnitutus sp.]|nr:hypothetical protein [Candidatus Didemnitutus sp.]
MPTTAERVVGVISSVLLCAAGGFSFWFSLTFLKNIWASLLTGGFAVASAYLVYHFAFTKGRKLQRPEIIRLAAVFTIVGLAALIGRFLVEDLLDQLWLLYIGLSGICGGILNFTMTKKQPNRPLRRNAGSRPSSGHSSASETSSSRGPRG